MSSIEPSASDGWLTCTLIVLVPDAADGIESPDISPSADSLLFALQLVFIAYFELDGVSESDIGLSKLIEVLGGVARIKTPSIWGRTSNKAPLVFPFAEYERASKFCPSGCVTSADGFQNTSFLGMVQWWEGMRLDSDG